VSSGGERRGGRERGGDGAVGLGRGVYKATARGWRCRAALRDRRSALGAPRWEPWPHALPPSRPGCGREQWPPTRWRTGDGQPRRVPYVRTTRAAAAAHGDGFGSSSRVRVVRGSRGLDVVDRPVSGLTLTEFGPALVLTRHFRISNLLNKNYQNLNGYRAINHQSARF